MVDLPQIPTQIAQIERQPALGDLAYDTLKNTIMRGAFAPGAKLTVRGVAQALGVSTTPARDAISRLIGEGALQNLGPKTVVVPMLTRGALEEVTAIRLVLEGLAAEQAAPNISQDDIEWLEQVQVKINAALDEGRYLDVMEANKAFHFLIYRRSGMNRLVAMIETMWLRIGPSFNDLYPEFAQTRQGVSNHLWAIRGLQDKDPAAVRAAIENDIRSGYRRLSSYVDRANAAE